MIGAGAKLNIIKNLMEAPQYQEYLGLEKFEDYISLPQKFACDDLEATEKMVASQLMKSTSKIFLMGMGHVKSGLIHRLSKYRNAVFLDVGASIDALAGIIDVDRPYAGDWTNYQIDDVQLYKGIDFLAYEGKGKHLVLERIMMITFNNLGNLGRLANQMFQYASLKGIARNRGFDFMIPPKRRSTRDLLVRQDGTNIYDIFDLSDNNYGLQVNQVCMERMHTFDEELFNNCPDNVDLLGYYQTHKYFQHIESEIRSDFKFQTDLFETCSDFMKDNFVYRDVISLHVRRGDYVSNPNHPLQTVEYYQRALEMLPNLDVIVFSDDPDWCNSQEIFQPDRFSISESKRLMLIYV